jgi:hypothetical protein
MRYLNVSSDCLEILKPLCLTNSPSNAKKGLECDPPIFYQGVPVHYFLGSRHSSSVVHRSSGEVPSASPIVRTLL